MKQMKRIFATILIACVVITMSGCRYSDTIQQILYDKYQDGMIDITAPFEYADNELDNELKSNELDDLEQQDDAERKIQEIELGIAQDSDEANTEEGYEVAFTETNGETNADVDDSEKSADADSKVKESDAGGVPHQDENSQSTGNASPTTTDDAGKDGVTGLGGEDAVGDANADTDKVVVTPSDNVQQLPTNVKTIAATGKLADMLVVLGCEQALVATDEETAKKAQNISAYSGLSKAEALWEGDGLAGLGRDGFNRLLELKPEVVVEISGSSTLSDTQIAMLKENGSFYFAVRAMTDLSYVENALFALGKVLGEDASERAMEYYNWAEHTYLDISKLSKNVADYTLYIDGWDSDVRILAEGVEVENGCAVVNGWNYEPTQAVSAFLKYAGITNASSLSQSPTKERGYFLPMEMQSGNSFTLSGGTLATKIYSRNYAWFSPSYVDSLPVRFGEGDTYQYVVAADRDTASGIEASKNRTNGMWSIYTDLITSQGDTFQYYGYQLGDNVMMISTIAPSGSYQVLTNPSGYSSWTQGGCESILETVWAAYRISGVIDEETMNNYIREFYSTFYNYNLTGDELTNILEGN